MVADSSLCYIKDTVPGITRKKKGKTFVYYSPTPHQERITDPVVLQRIRALCIPPAYKEVWISPLANSHLQATGRDSKNRKQYRYHSLWRQLRDENKFSAMVDFGKALPKIRQHVDTELNKPLKINKEQIISAIIFLLDNHFIRIGNSIYEKQNASYGLTTLRKKHLTINGAQAQLKFDGKNLKSWHIVLKDKKIIKILRKCEAIPGYKLFKYLDEDKNYVEITSQDINSYLQHLTKHDFTAKDFRTWGACREVFFHLCQTPYVDEPSASKKLPSIITEVATLLGHTPKICQKSYIDPEIINHWKAGKVQGWIQRRTRLLTNKDQLFLRWLQTYATFN